MGCATGLLAGAVIGALADIGIGAFAARKERDPFALAYRNASECSV